MPKKLRVVSNYLGACRETDGRTDGRAARGREGERERGTRGKFQRENCMSCCSWFRSRGNLHPINSKSC
jgi:hypothetical protein